MNCSPSPGRGHGTAVSPPVSVTHGICTAGNAETISPLPVYSRDVLEFCASTQKGPVGNAAKPHGLTISGSIVCAGAALVLEETRLVTRYCAKAGAEPSASRHTPATANQSLPANLDFRADSGMRVNFMLPPLRFSFLGFHTPQSSARVTGGRFGLARQEAARDATV